jgi:hypothetical protein
MPAAQELLPYPIQTDPPTRAVERLGLFWTGRDNALQSGTLAPKTGTLAVANLAPDPARAARVLIPPPSRPEETIPVAVQAARGLGRVTLVAFDLDRPPFTDFAERPALWDWVLREGGAARASVGQEHKPLQGYAGPTDDEDELAVAVRSHIDTFDGVPVISFGWVAMFIVLYIILIGPVEYLFLKRILGRLELTWVTFPVIVLTVSAAAYFTAYAVKGRDLKVNKVDLVEVDPASGRVYGTAWVSIFSPRIATYTVGVTPAEGWTAEPDEPGGTLVGWVGGPQGGRGGFVRRRYAYHTDPAAGVVADGMTDVPIQVWSTKSFTARWSGKLDPKAPVVESRLEHPPGDPTKVIGAFVNRMPFDRLSDCVAFYAGQAYPLPGGVILKGQTVRLVLDKGESARKWLQERGQLADLLARASAYTGRTDPRAGTRSAAAPAAPGAALPLLGVMFHEAALSYDEGVYPRNASFRRLDQSWRLSEYHRDEVILVGRVTPPVGPAEERLGGPASPSRLWLKGLPGSGEKRWDIPGAARQETYVRVYLPVKPASGGLAANP